MFVVIRVVDTIRIPPNMLSVPTKIAVHREMDNKYSNRVLMDVGLMICRYGDCLSIGDGVCVAGDAGAHHECVVRLIVFRPFVEEVCVGTIVKSTEAGIQVCLGDFFEDIFIPAYWMLRPSHFEIGKRIWVWTPEYDSGGGEEDDCEKEKKQSGETPIKLENNENDVDGTDQENWFEMETGCEIRFRVKSINFTQVTNTAKGVQATTITTTSNAQSSHNSFPPSSITNEATTLDSNMISPPVRKRSSSIELTDFQQAPATMQIVASICEDGLGLTTWWTAANDNEGDDDG